MKFSIIIPTYKRLDYLEEAIKSIVAQTYQEYEIVVVNDYPGDKSAIDQLCSGYDRIRVIHQAVSRGGNAARNAGIDHSDGELIAFLDDDDIWKPEKLELHYEAHLKHPEAGLIYSNCIYWWNHPKMADAPIKQVLPENILDKMRVGQACPCSTSLVSLRRDSILKCGSFDESLTSFQDWDLWFRIAHHYPFYLIEKPLIYFRQHLGLRTSQNEQKRLEGFSQIKRKWGKEINIKEFTLLVTRNILYQNAYNLALAGKNFQAVIQGLKVFNPQIFDPASFNMFARILSPILLSVESRGRLKKFLRLTEQ
jgi:glycosyltransferase involved in cell wall biosynthesis